jgi:hypothetical protein
MRARSQRQQGVVSLFLVIFSALLIVTVTIAFISIMILDQQQATTNDLSKSALDSANAGVEDAKRAILTYDKNQCDGSGSATDVCKTLASSLNSNACNTIQQSGIAGSLSNSEVQVGQNEADSELQQAYTCVKVNLDTTDYVGSLKPNESRVIPLKATDGTKTVPFDRVTIEWFSVSDLQNAQVPTQADGTKTIAPLGTDLTLQTAAKWPQNMPSILRTQLLQFGGSFKLTDFDVKTVSNADSATLFLMPSSIGFPNNLVNFADDYTGYPPGESLEHVKCDQSFSTVSTGSAYACSATITLPLPVGATDNKNRTAYLRLLAPYNAGTSFRVTMQDSTTNAPVLFDGVQPSVDSTGRANDLFRRVVDRVEFNSNFPYVEGTLDITGDLCKTFSISTVAAGFTNNCPSS